MPGKIQPFSVGGQVSTAASTVDTDHVFAFIPRRTATLDRVCWNRDNGTAGNAYVGVYSSAGVLLTNCAVDSDTTTGWHAVDTTNVLLLNTSYYYICINVSVDIAGTMLTNGGWPMDAPNASAGKTAGAIHPDYILWSGLNTDLGAAEYIATKARANAALLSSLTLSGFSAGSSMPAMGLQFA
jgi:hypothetical protein